MTHGKEGSGVGIYVGCVVAVRFLPQGPERSYLLVADGEPSSPEQGVISANTPLARSLLGRKAGEIVEFSAPRGVRKRIKIKLVICS